MTVPWFMLSPSPISLIQYAILTYIVYRYLVKHVERRKFFVLLDSFFVVAFWVCVTDSFWAFWCALRWIPLYPNDSLQIVSSFFRDVVGALLFYLFICLHFKNGTLTFRGQPIIYLIICLCSQCLWFMFAPSPAYTDYTFAFRHGYGIGFVFADFLFSHFVMRVPLWLMIWKTLKLKWWDTK